MIEHMHTCTSTPGGWDCSRGTRRCGAVRQRRRGLSGSCGSHLPLKASGCLPQLLLASLHMHQFPPSDRLLRVVVVGGVSGWLPGWSRWMDSEEILGGHAAGVCTRRKRATIQHQ